MPDNGGIQSGEKLVRDTLGSNFWEKVNKTESCWLWKGSTNKKGRQGYGRFRLNNKLYGTHKLSYADKFNRWDIIDKPEIKCLHKCDTPKCVNPNHLFLGTQKDNVQDMASKGRHQNNKDFCKHGHEFTPDNMYVRKDLKTGFVRRQCKICTTRRAKEYKQREKEKRQLNRRRDE